MQAPVSSTKQQSANETFCTKQDHELVCELLLNDNGYHIRWYSIWVCALAFFTLAVLLALSVAIVEMCMEMYVHRHLNVMTQYEMR